MYCTVGGRLRRHIAEVKEVCLGSCLSILQHNMSELEVCLPILQKNKRKFALEVACHHCRNGSLKWKYWPMFQSHKSEVENMMSLFQKFVKVLISFVIIAKNVEINWSRVCQYGINVGTSPMSIVQKARTNLQREN